MNSVTIKIGHKLLLLLLVGSALILSVSAASLEKNDLCSTPLCNQIANNIDSSINHKVNPCDNFYEYACGGWKANHTIPKESSSYEQFDIVMERLEELIRDSLNQSATNHKSNALVVNYTRYVYEQCMNAGDDPTELAILLNYYMAIPFNFTKLMTEAIPWDELYVKTYMWTAVSPWISISVQPDPKNVTTNILTFDSQSFVIGDKELQNLEENRREIDAYRRYIEKMWMYFEAKNNTELAHKIDLMIQMDSDLAKVKLSPEKQRNPNVMYNKMSLKQMSELTQYDWLGKIVIPLFKHLDVHNIPDNATQVLVTDVNYYVEGVKILNKYDKIPHNFNYPLLQVLLSYSQYSNTIFRKFAFEFAQVLEGVEKQEETSKFCMDRALEDLPMALSRVFVDSHFPDSDKKAAEKLVQNIHQAYQNLITENKWLDEDTRKSSLDKLQKVRINVGYPDWLLDDNKLDTFYGFQDKKFYEGLTKHFLDGVSDFRIQQAEIMFNQLFDQLSVDYRWPMPPAIVNAAYEPTQNSITIPAGILALPFFQADQPTNLNFGAIGVIIGHELTHGLDDEGRQYDAQGNLHSWWSKDAIAQFQNLSHCFVEQYGSQVDKSVNLHVNGQLTLGENIADNGGVHEAYRAYRNAQAKSPSQRLAKLPEFNTDQLFFLSFAQNWCGLIRPEALRQQIEYDPHSPMQFRVNVPFYNSEDFSKTFKCPAGSPMNPEKKCQLW